MNARSGSGLWETTANAVRACLLTQDRKLARAVTRTLVPRRIQVDQFQQFPEPADILLSYAFVLIDSDLDEPSIIELKLAQAGTDRKRVIVFSQSRGAGHLATLLGKCQFSNFIAKNGGIREEELLITMHKLLTKDLFGMAQYLTHGTMPIVRSLDSPKERSEALSNVVRFLEECMVSKRFIELARSAADELLMNALYRAPRDEISSRLSNPHPVELQYACDGRYVGISVSDRYGSLTEDRLFGFLRRCFAMDEYKTPSDTEGGGLGLYVAYRSADQLVINISRGIRTEVICLMDIRGRMRDFEGRTKSLHLFITENELCPVA